MIPILLLNTAARDVAASGLTWVVVVIATLQCVAGAGGLGLVLGAWARDRWRGRR